MKRSDAPPLLAAVFIAAALSAGCAHGPRGPAAASAAPASTSNGNVADLVISAELDSGAPAEVRAAWLEYGAVLASEWASAPAPASAAGAADYTIEVRARARLADRWKAARGRGAVRDPYLDTLVEVRAAGFIEEYVAAFMADSGWTIPAADLRALDIGGFEQWAAGHLDGHRPVTLVTFHPGLAQARPPVPGAGLPGSDEIDPRRVPCSASQAAVTAALRDWDTQARRLGHVPLSIGDGEHLLPGLDAAAHEPRARAEGVIFVSPKVGQVAFIAGFCALDRGDLAGAERLLRRAVALSPGNPNVRGELVQTLIAMKKLDQADAELDTAIRLAVSSCNLGVLWRKRGYILFDRGKLVDSYAAYAKSLGYDPGNDIATREMALIVSELRRAGGYDAKALESYRPPPAAAGKLRVTQCR